MLNNLLWYDIGMTATRIDSVSRWTQSAAFHTTASIIHATLALGDRGRPLELVSTAVGLRLGKKEQRRWNMFCLQESWNHGLLVQWNILGNDCKQCTSFLCHGKLIPWQQTTVSGNPLQNYIKLCTHPSITAWIRKDQSLLGSDTN